MGMPSDKRRSARRPGQQERARAKKRLQYGYGIRRGGMWSSAWGADTVSAKLGRKKMQRQVNISRGQCGLPILSVNSSNLNVGQKS